MKENGKSVKEQKRYLVLQGTKATCILYKGSGNETGGLGMRLEVWERDWRSGNETGGLGMRLEVWDETGGLELRLQVWE